MTLCGLGKSVWPRIKSSASAGSIAPNHGLVGKSPNRHGVINNQEEDIHAHFQDLKSLCDVQATRFVREQTGLVTEHDNDDSAVYLPTSMGKRHCYGRYCLARGYKIETDNVSNTTIIEDEDFDDTRKECPSWTMYWRFWKKNYPELKFSTRPPSSSLYSSEDTNIQEEDSDDEEDDTCLEPASPGNPQQHRKIPGRRSPRLKRQSPRRQSPRLKKKKKKRQEKES
eukprot:scaffold32401_cov53-Attheya_sp.AAC.2